MGRWLPFFYGMRRLAPRPTPNLVGLCFLLRWPSLSHYAPLFIKAGYEEDMGQTCDSRLDGRANDTMGISQHLRNTFGGPNVLHRGSFLPFNTKFKEM